MDLVSILRKLPFNTSVASRAGKVYAVGGSVRDSLLGKNDYKDLDLVITGIPKVDLVQLLQQYGRVDEVGESFGVIKFTIKGATAAIDIALPRTDKKVGDKHTDFEVIVDHNLSIEDDLLRRDFTINAIAMDINGKLIDPLNGVTDLNSKVLRLCNPDGFRDDPLRMLRGVQFASRFDLHFDLDTLTSLVENVNLIKHVSKERILIELEKVVSKGNCVLAKQLLVNTGLSKGIFNMSTVPEHYGIIPEHITRLSEFMFYILGYNNIDIFLNDLKGDHATYKELKAIRETINVMWSSNDFYKNRDIYNAAQISDVIFRTNFFCDEISKQLKLYQEKKYPKSRKELDIDGTEVMELGFKGPDIALAINKVVHAILADKLPNEKSFIKEFLKSL